LQKLAKGCSESPARAVKGHPPMNGCFYKFKSSYVIKNLRLRKQSSESIGGSRRER